MVVYDRMLALGLQPDEALNRVLVHVCNIDPLSVAWNAAPARLRGPPPARGSR
jgi:hypothetical protein